MKAALTAQLALADGHVPVVHFVREPLTPPNFGGNQAAVVRRMLARGALQIANSPATAQTLRGRVRTLLPPVETPSSLTTPTRTGPRNAACSFLEPLFGEGPGVCDRGPCAAAGIGGVHCQSRQTRHRRLGRLRGDDAEAERLRALVQRKALTGTVRFWPWTSDPFSAIVDADVVIVPSQVQEGFSQVAAQALIMGAPTVLPAGAGIVSAVDLPSTACTFAWDQAGSFRQAVDQALERAHARRLAGGNPTRRWRSTGRRRVAGSWRPCCEGVPGLPAVDQQTNHINDTSAGLIRHPLTKATR